MHIGHVWVVYVTIRILATSFWVHIPSNIFPTLDQCCSATGREWQWLHFSYSEVDEILESQHLWHIIAHIHNILVVPLPHHPVIFHVVENSPSHICQLLKVRGRMRYLFLSAVVIVCDRFRMSVLRRICAFHQYPLKYPKRLRVAASLNGVRATPNRWQTPCSPPRN